MLFILLSANQQYIDTKSVHQSDVQTTGVNLFMMQSVDLICKFNTRKESRFHSLFELCDIYHRDETVENCFRAM